MREENKKVNKAEKNKKENRAALKKFIPMLKFGAVSHYQFKVTITLTYAQEDITKTKKKTKKITMLLYETP